MTDRLTALEELKAKVEVGEVVDENGLAIRTDVADLSDLVFGPELIFPFVDAFEGSIDAAMTLKDATLPGWKTQLFEEDDGSFNALLRDGEDDRIYAEVWSSAFARALLLANIKALIQKEKTND